MRLKELRNERGMRQQEVADRLGLPIGTYRKYEYGDRQVPLEILVNLADLYEVSIDYLMERKTSPSDLDKAQLSSIYDMLNDDGKGLLLTMARLIVKSGEYLSI